MLSNAYFLAKFRFDTAENEPARIFQKVANFANLPLGNQPPTPEGNIRRSLDRGHVGGLGGEVRPVLADAVGFRLLVGLLRVRDGLRSDRLQSMN